jgi:hypothetical protein
LFGALIEQDNPATKTADIWVSKFSHLPEIPTTQWSVGSIYLHSYTIRANPGNYRLSFGLWLKDGDEEAVRLKTKPGDVGINMGWHEVP